MFQIMYVHTRYVNYFKDKILRMTKNICRVLALNTVNGLTLLSRFSIASIICSFCCSNRFIPSKTNLLVMCHPSILLNKIDEMFSSRLNRHTVDSLLLGSVWLRLQMVRKATCALSHAPCRPSAVILSNK